MDFLWGKNLIRIFSMAEMWPLRRLTGSRAASNASIHSLRSRPSFMDRDKDKTPAFLTQLQEKLRFKKKHLIESGGGADKMSGSV